MRPILGHFKKLSSGSNAYPVLRTSAPQQTANSELTRIMATGDHTVSHLGGSKLLCSNSTPGVGEPAEGGMGSLTPSQGEEKWCNHFGT